MEKSGASGNLNAAVGVHLLNIPVGSVDRSQGDVHPNGNPDYINLITDW